MNHESQSHFIQCFCVLRFQYHLLRWLTTAVFIEPALLYVNVEWRFYYRRNSRRKGEEERGGGSPRRVTRGGGGGWRFMISKYIFRLFLFFFVLLTPNVTTFGIILITFRTAWLTRPSSPVKARTSKLTP